MVRTIVGTSLEAAKSRDPAAAMRAVLDSGERAKAGITAPAGGLCLERVYYEEGRT
jgi:tRNA pseudouridine38-40 synthase